MSYQGNFTQEQIERIRDYRKDLIQKRMNVPAHGAIVEHQGRPGNFYFVLPTVHHPNEGSVPLLENWRLPETNPLAIGKRGSFFDFGCGSGVLAIEAAKKGYLSVAYDVNSHARKSTTINSMIQNSSLNQVEVKEHLHEGHYNYFYDFIAGNLPFTNEPSSNIAQRAAYDSGLACHKEFFDFSKECLTKDGKVLLAQANFGAVDQALEMGREAGFSDQRLIGKMDAVWNDVPVVFYALELRRAK